MTLYDDGNGGYYEVPDQPDPNIYFGNEIIPNILPIPSAGTIPFAMWRQFIYPEPNFGGTPEVSEVYDINIATGNAPPRICRWVGRFPTVPATYRFNYTTDDGMAIWVDGQIVFKNWNEGGHSGYVDVDLYGDSHTLEVWNYNVRPGPHAAALMNIPVKDLLPPSGPAPFPPFVISTSPTNNQQYVSPGAAIFITFDHELGTNSINEDTILVRSVNDGALLTGKYSYDNPSKTVKFVPNNILSSNTQYSVTVTSKVVDIEGLSLIPEYNFGFSTDIKPIFPPAGDPPPIIPAPPDKPPPPPPPVFTPPPPPPPVFTPPTPTFKPKPEEPPAKAAPVATPVSLPAPPPPDQPITFQTVESTTSSTYTGYRNIPIRVNVLPATPSFIIQDVRSNSTVEIKPIIANLQKSISDIVSSLITDKIPNFFDDDRNLKTVLNFGRDTQALITNWNYDDIDITGKTIKVKLYRPLPSFIGLEEELWISRELSPPIIDNVYIQAILQRDLLKYLRPPNRDVKVVGKQGYSVSDVTLSSLIPSASSATSSFSPDDDVLNKFYTTDLVGIELNVNYADYRQFVHFGSAESRLNTFKTKLSLIESYDSKIEQWKTAFFGLSGSVITGSQAHGYAQGLSEQKKELIRSFDGYEKFLYYEIGIPYSSSITPFNEDGIEYHSDATWPKDIYGMPLSISNLTAQGWHSNQISIARKYDRGNQNYLKNNLPQYLVRDIESNEFLYFIDMIGHHFDIIKPYIDEMTKIYNRENSPNVGLSKDLIWNVAQSVGVELPNEYSIKKLAEYTIGTAQNEKVYRDIVAETWKRFLHNQIYITKSKGTKTAIQALINTYGVLPSLIRIRETISPNPFEPTGSMETYEEYTNVINFSQPSYINVPWTGSSNTIEVRFSPTSIGTSVVLNAGNSWALKSVSTSGTNGYLVLVNAANSITVSSSIFPLFDGSFYTTMIRLSGSKADLYVKSTINQDFDVSSTTREIGTSISSSWATPTNITLGGSGSFFGSPFTGYMDEFRIWSEVLSDETYNTHVLYPGLYSGNTSASAINNLLVRLSFNVPRNLAVSGSVINESPYAFGLTAGNSLLAFTASFFPTQSAWPYSMKSVSREVTVFNSNSTGTAYSSNKIVIAPEPTLRFNSYGLPELSRNQSVVSLADKQNQMSSSNLIGMYFSITDAINDSIYRSMGIMDLDDIIGNPADQYKENYTKLDILNSFYWTNYAYDYNLNNFVDFTQNLLSGFFTQVKEIVPARSKLLTGLVIEPTILERNKITFKKPQTTLPYVNMAGSLNYEVTVQKKDDIISLLPIVQSDTQNIEVIVNTTDESGVLQVTPEMIDVIVTPMPTIYPLTARDVSLLVVISPKVAKGVFITYYENVGTTISIHDYYKSMTKFNAFAPTAVYSMITSTSDFSEIGATTYFWRLNGLYPTIGYQQVREYNNSLVARGNWTSNTSYNRYDFVTDLADGNEYRCVAGIQFISAIAPHLDTNKWNRMKYINVPFIIMKKAVWQNNKVVFVPNTSALAPFVGYAPYHYRFTRDTTTATMRNRYYGCKQTQDTTADGKPVVEITVASGNKLFVTDASDPVQKTNEFTGPILRVE